MDNKEGLDIAEIGAEKKNAIGIVAYESLSPKLESMPEANQDRVLNLHDTGVYGVFDGMGGHENGDLFAEAAKKFMQSQWQEVRETDPEAIKKRMGKSLIDAARVVSEQIPGNGGTTAAMVVTTGHEGKRYAIAGGVGDSSIILYRNGELIKLVDEDQGAINQVVAAKGLWPEDAIKEARRIAHKLDNVQTDEDFQRLSRDEKFCYAQRYLTGQSIRGGRTVVPHVNAIELFEGDELVLMTDGIRDNLADDEIKDCLKYSTKKDKAKILDGAAGARIKNRAFRGKPDDRGIIYLSVQSKSDQKARSGESNPLGELKGKQFTTDRRPILNLDQHSMSDPTIRLPRKEGPIETARKDYDLKSLASEVWINKGNLLKAETKNTWDIRSAGKPIFLPNGRLSFPDKIEGFSFDPKQLIKGIFAADFNSNDGIQIYYPNEQAGKLTKTEFIASVEEAVNLLLFCARQTGWSEQAVIGAVKHLTTGMTVSLPQQDRDHWKDASFALEEALDNRRLQLV